jgi:hypothetical protein
MAGSGIRFSFDPGAAGSAGHIEAGIYDLGGAGVAVLPVTRDVVQGFRAELRRGMASPGAYVLRVRGGEWTASTRFVLP